MNYPSAVIFDMDGTLINNMSWHKKSWMMFLEHHNISMTPDDFEKINHGTLYDIMPRIFGDKLTHAESYELGMVKEKMYRDLYAPHLKPINGLTDFLVHLKENNILIGLATAADYTNTWFTLDALKIRSFFTEVVTSDTVPEGKPSPAVYMAAAKALKVDPASCLVFEDTVSGIQSAKAAGMQVVAVISTLSENQLEQEDPALIIKDYEGLQLSSLQKLVPA